jgi:hypothetical protein
MLSKKLQDQIEQEAKAEAKKLTARVPIFRFGYEAGWNDAGEKYATLYETAIARAERAEKALNLIAQMSDPGDHWVAVCKMKSIAVDALTDYNTYKNGKDGTREEATGSV